MSNMDTEQLAYATPLTILGEDEVLFRDTVRQFAQQSIGPLVSQMDEEQHFSADLLPQLFNLGLMGIEIPVEYGGAGGNLFRGNSRGGTDIRGRSFGRGSG